MAHAAIGVSLLGTGAPPGTLLGVPMTPAILDPTPIFADVLSAPLTTGKSVLFNSPMSHRRIGSGWASWSHGYTGDVYYSNDLTTITMTFSQPDITAFYFYAEAVTFGPFTATISATGSGGATAASSQIGEGFGGAVGFGLVGTGTTTLTSVTLSVALVGFPKPFAVGEFGWSKDVPAPGGLAVLGMACLTGRRRRR